ncbi:trifunctional transcriptional regulator/proline dehydrogenase/L-glutamate gamma-semialdehyde dehydrogenase [Crenobacter cavernae]|uniref:Bifunctional protein PutA n=1 Tax=Crenobacter cavernae TaxID=2290923 RepID=A0A345Y9L5_9NEIS|nr:trifunctional transcriptional regulator/proline dehydrogenase/L-glutamate gamma-semialdehyde dehydrogenase [Crenobacter cavernae]AXK40617.1 trifunctional transcriptional regulator/proline dehydrogenase/L-glutamate gamma-semialdehyde dehydrogenase [Crenobacter cavernae]
MTFEPFAHAQSELRDAITAAYRLDERDCVRALLPQAALPADQVAAIQDLARRLVSQVRRERTKSSGVDALMHEFSLASEEGVALMCLAEALLRIPDRETADKLIRDKISRGDWRSHLGNSASLFVNAAAWGLLVTGKLVSSASEKGLSSALTRLIAKGGEPLIRKGVDLAMRMLGKQFVTGETIEEALANGREREARGYRFSYDMLGEAAMTEADAQRYLKDYETAIHAIGRASNGRGVYEGPGISVKLSAIHPRYARAKHERVMTELLPRLKQLFLLARQYGIGLNIDAEEADRLELSLDLVAEIARDPQLAGFKGIGVVVQAYQKRCPYVIDYLVDLARATHNRFMVRLVKGAYWDAEIKRAQVDGLDGYPVYTRKVYTDVAYLACSKKLLAAQDAIYPQFATHNAHTLAAVYQMAQGKDYEFQCLHGMGETLYDQVVGSANLNKPCRIYAPVGSHETLLAYLVRRLLENGANSSFVNRIVDESVSIDELVADPVAETIALDGVPHAKIPLPVDLYGGVRLNSAGIDLSNEQVLSRLQQDLLVSQETVWRAVPMLAERDVEHGEVQAVLNPANRHDIVGEVIEASAADVEAALAAAHDAADEWAATPVDERADCLERMADLMEERMGVLMGIAVREAGKTLPNAISEVREAVDFCRYYASQVRVNFDNVSQPAIGPVVAISPWNFPLAIFIGEVSAALAAGNPVLAKPAEQTALIAAEAVRLFHEAGVPRAVLQFMPGRGETVGAALTRDARVKGVIFTGSTEVAQIINKTLAERDTDTVLIAETGGQNVMIVDSSSLPEQVVADVLSSAFDSAGQRCSALRVLYLQSDIADKVVEMIEGAMDELAVGNPARLATDVGPVIDAEARQNLMNHIDAMKGVAKRCHQAALTTECADGTFVPPTLFEIDHIGRLKREVFGPVLHVIRFDASELDRVIDEVNSSGYGLTHGVHSRIDETIDAIVSRVAAGNVYVNRNIVGAVVGVQPFGGEGLSGSGPKAGGPFYLYRLSGAGEWHPSLKARRSEVKLPALESLAELLPRLPLTPETQHRLARQLAQARAASPLWDDVELPGPTGENNSLRFAPRGAVGCLASNDAALVAMLIAAFATGNKAVLADGGISSTLKAGLGAAVSVAPDLASADIAVLLFDGVAAEAAALRQRLATREGALVSLVTANDEGEWNLHRLIVERAVSVNTTAAGGNASLMSLEA